ncbi:MFS transporter [Meiothermus granaticius]|uniref:H+ Antiporter protein n=1 Tax=Meiothermus granaticius NBRC 107808 TaxID=1227551 RepID=A0A399FDN9_9DEIN|nr:MFS transporter [Meiothermus granaticius]RIH93926.1 H+ Antiporter protein [Meiothermus granaticius NBRC 107808]
MRLFKAIDANLFRLVWGQGAATFSDNILGMALPLLAALILHASPAQMGLLATVEMLPWLLVTLFAGVWIDQGSPQRVLVYSAVLRGVLLLSIPLGVWAGWFSFPWLVGVTLLIGILQVFFDLAVNAFVASAVDRNKLVGANSQIESSRMVARVGAPGLGGVLVQTLGGPLTILINAVLDFVAALLLQRIPAREGPRMQNRKLIWGEIGAGLKAVLYDPYLRPLVFSTTNYNLHVGILTGIKVLFLVRELHVPPVWIGLILGAQSAGGLLGATLAPRVSARLGLGRTAILGMLLAAMAAFVAPLVYAPPLIAAGLIAAAGFAGAVAIVVCNVNVVSLRQARTAPQMQGRVAATSRFISFGLGSLGGLLGGLLAEALGLRVGMLIAALIATTAFGWLYFSPVREVRKLPTPTEG